MDRMMSISSEFEVVILSGGSSSRAASLFSRLDLPGCLLPISNRPLLFYQLEMVRNMGFHSVTVLTRMTHVESIKSVVSAGWKETNFKVNVEGSREDLTSCGALTNLLNSPLMNKSQLIVIGGDLVANHKFVYSMIDNHMRNEASMTMAYQKLSLPPPSKDPSKQVKISGTDYLGVDPDSNQMYLLASADDHQPSEEEVVPLKVKHSILNQFHRIKFIANMVNVNFYILGKPALEALSKNRITGSLSKELVPWMLRAQYRPHLISSVSSSNAPSKQAGGSSSSASSYQELIQQPSSTSQTTTTSSSSLTESKKDKVDPNLLQARSSSVLPISSSLAPIRVFYHEIDPECYSLRVNTLANFVTVNRAVASGTIFAKPVEPRNRSSFVATDVSQGIKVMLKECVVGSGTKLGDEVIASHSVIGPSCSIDSKSIVNNCVIMDNVTIGSGCELQGVVVCSGCSIQAGSKLKETVVAPPDPSQSLK